MSAATERELWVRVILQAITDATTITDAATDTESNLRRSNRNIAYLNRERARLWFRATNRDFIEVCNLAGMNPDDVAERASAAIAQCDAAEAKGERFSVYGAMPKATTIKRK